MATRYDRQMQVPGVGSTGQARVRASHVLVIGAGGLSSPVLAYLAGAGVGQVTIVDDDVVELSNLHRQVIHSSGTVGGSKVASAAARVRAINPDVQVVAHDQRFTRDGGEALVAGHDVVVDGSDNFPTRYAVNAAAVGAGVPLVWGAVQEMGGQVAVVDPCHGPCYRCVFPQPPAPGSVPSCVEAGVLGPVPGVLGAVMATEALKVLTGLGQPLTDGVLVHEATDQSWQKVRVRRDVTCPDCGDAGQRRPAPADAASVAEVGPDDVPPGATVVDVRTDQERSEGYISDSWWRPLESLKDSLDLDLPPGSPSPIVLYCESGQRSAQAAQLLHASGEFEVCSLRGGIRAWKRSGLPTVAPSGGAPVDTSQGSSGPAPGEHAAAVLEIAASIPPGRVMSYGQIAETLGTRGARAVGQAMSRYGAHVPWWRVVHSTGDLPGRAEEARARLSEEGTPMRGARIDMAQARWRPSEGDILS